MANRQELNWNLEQLTDAEIYAAIDYLDPDPASVDEQDHPTVLVICVILLILLSGCL